jgi:hypothetical protein
MTDWPKWLRITFILSGGVFVLAVLFSAYVVTSHAIIPPLSVQNPSGPSYPGQPKVEPTTIVNIITALAGLLTAGSALYGQILAGRKQRMDYELAKQQMKMQAKSAAPRKTNRRRKR